MSYILFAIKNASNRLHLSTFFTKLIKKNDKFKKI